jgi:hypothetical protein
MGFRTQHACGGAAEIARATGTNTPTSSRTSSNLAVARCMSFKSYLDGRLPRQNQFTAIDENKRHKVAKSLVDPIALGDSGAGLVAMTPTTAGQDHPNHGPQRKQSEVGESSELREHHACFDGESIMQVSTATVPYALP